MIVNIQKIQKMVAKVQKKQILLVVINNLK